MTPADRDRLKSVLASFDEAGLETVAAGAPRLSRASARLAMT